MTTTSRSARGRRARIPAYPYQDGPIYRHREMPQVAVFLHALTPESDPGETTSLYTRNLLNSLRSERLVTFDPDEFFDYTQLRPIMRIKDGSLADWAMPDLAIDLLHDDEGTPLALMHGPAPQLGWGRFTQVVVALMEEMGVTLALGVRALIAGLPHTRPGIVMGHANRAGLLHSVPALMEDVQVAASLTSMVEWAIGQAGIGSVGLSASVPFYAAEYAYITDLALPFGSLEAASLQVGSAIEANLENNERVSRLVHELEENYDQNVNSGRSEAAQRIPNAEEIGAKAEAYLADITDQRIAVERSGNPFFPGSDEQPESSRSPWWGAIEGLRLRPHDLREEAKGPDAHTSHEAAQESADASDAPPERGDHLPGEDSSAHEDVDPDQNDEQ
ncbi:MAG: PAC2 family protein [Bowdeniella nasicola]|nr:PAC2 family protein [Bowdeniella nasicola]